MNELIDKIYEITLKEGIDKLPRIEQIKRYIELYKELSDDKETVE